MHLRGKDMDLHAAIYPGRPPEIVLSVPSSIRVADRLLAAPSRCAAKGNEAAGDARTTTIRSEPEQSGSDSEVRWGDQTWEEMMFTWVTYSAADAPRP